MISEKEALELFTNLKQAESTYKLDPTVHNKRNLDKIESAVVDKMYYLVKMKSSRYKKFSNYEDLNQDGLEALIKGLKTYQVGKGSIFWWLHKYIDTKISRSANQHTTIRFPLRIARDQAPIKEQLTNKTLKMQSDIVSIEPEIENRQILKKISEVCETLPKEQRSILYDHFGLDQSIDAKSIKQISTEKNMSKKSVESSIKNSLEKIKNIVI